MHSKATLYRTIALAAVLGALPAAGRAGPDLTSPRAYADRLRDFAALKRMADHLQEREGVRMLLAIAQGSQMGPGEGWFKPGQSRYHWKWLAERFDADKDGQVSKDELAEEFFAGLDRNRDGKLDAEDFDWADKSNFARQAGLAGQWMRFMDKNSNGRLTKDEWQAFFDRVAKDKGYVTPEDLRLALNPPTPQRSKSDGPSPLVLIKGLIEGELGSFREGPAVDAPAPDFTLKTQDGKQTIRLEQFKGKKPVVLIFGSFT